MTLCTGQQMVGSSMPLKHLAEGLHSSYLNSRCCYSNLLSSTLDVYNHNKVYHNKSHSSSYLNLLHTKFGFAISNIGSQNCLLELQLTM